MTRCCGPRANWSRRRGHVVRAVRRRRACRSTRARCAAGDLFVALLGEGRDGHAFVADALAKGAAGAMVHDGRVSPGPVLRVDDTLAALTRLGGSLAARFGGRPVVAVTGSVGKTTTKEMLRAALAAFGTSMRRSRRTTTTGACR